MKGSLGLWTVGLCFLLLGAYIIAAPSAGGYHLLKKIPL